MIAHRFRPVVWVVGCAVAATALYTVSLGVASERTRLEDLDHKIAMTHRDIRQLQTELGTRASLRQLERRCLTAFGHRPKTVLRRSRFLDMATALRGFSDPDQETLAAPRYFDQSHKTREFRHFIGLTPGKFDKQATPLLTAGLKLRAEGVA